MATCKNCGGVIGLVHKCKVTERTKIPTRDALTMVLGTSVLVLIAIIIALCIVLALKKPAHAQDGHAKYHQSDYKRWTNGKGGSCCSKTDCRPAKTRWLPTTGWQVWVVNRWCAIPKDKVRPYKSPDGGPHVCALTQKQYDYYKGYGGVQDVCEHIFCYVRGEPKG